MSKHSTNLGEYKEMYLINKFQKDIMENGMLNMSSEKVKSKEISPTLNMISQKTQTNTTDDLNETKDLPVESVAKAPTQENSESNNPMEINNNIQEELSKKGKLKNDSEDKKNEITQKMLIRKKQKFIQSQKYQLKECKQEICQKTSLITCIKISRKKYQKFRRKKHFE